MHHFVNVYENEKKEFIRQFERQDPVFAEFLVRLRAHEAKYFEEDYGMTNEDIRNCEDSLQKGASDEDRAFTAKDAHMYIQLGLAYEEGFLKSRNGLRDRAKAAWRKNPRYQALHANRKECISAAAPKD